MNVSLSREALSDLDRIAEYIARDDPVVALQWIEKLVERAMKIGDHPRSGRIVPELRDPDYREVIHGNYRIVYRIAAAGVQVVTFVEGHKLLPRR